MSPCQGNSGNSSSTPSTMWIVRLEEGQEELIASIRVLEKAINEAKETVTALLQDAVQARKTLQAAERRYEISLKFTQHCCTSCFRMLPFLESDDDAKLNDNVDDQCLLCHAKLSLEEEKKSGSVVEKEQIRMPPKDVKDLQRSKKAMEYSKYLLDMPETTGGCKMMEPPARLNDYESLTSSNTTKQWYNGIWDDEVCPSLFLLQKQSFLYAAHGALAWAQQRVAKTENAITQWTKYQQQHDQELDQVTARLTDVQRRIVAALQDKLAAYGDDSEELSSPTTHCMICEDRVKNVVFQCGHQCCHECSLPLSTCHLCRGPITQRITMFG